jgi:hypothetical protein
MAPSWLILEHRRVVDLQKRTGLVDDCDGGLNADINPEMHGHRPPPARTARLAPRQPPKGANKANKVRYCAEMFARTKRTNVYKNVFVCSPFLFACI